MIDNDSLIYIILIVLCIVALALFPYRLLISIFFDFLSED